jgi:hypothetical protein
LDILQHLVLTLQCPIPEGLSHYAARSGNISMLSWLKAERLYVFAQFACSGAATGGHLAALQHLRSEGCEWSKDFIARDAASSGSIEVVEWLRQQGLVINADVLSTAAGAGKMAMCAHLGSTGCAWDDEACSEAAVYGQLDTLRWLRQHGCPWDLSEVVINAAVDGHPGILDYVIEQGEVLSAELLTSALNWAGAYCQLRTAQWLSQRGAEWPAVLDGGDDPELRPWSGESLIWARADGCTSPVSL